MGRYDIYFEDDRCDPLQPLPLVPPQGAVWAVCTTGVVEVLVAIEERWVDVRIAREALDWSVEELARRCEVSLKTVIELENGQVPAVDARQRIQAVLDSPADS